MSSHTSLSVKVHWRRAERVVVEAVAWPGGVVYFGHLALPLSSLVLTQSAWIPDEPATLGPNRRPALIIGCTQVLLTELACYRVRRDVASGAARLNSAALRLLSDLAARACRQLAHLHGVGNWRPTRRCEGARASGWRHVRVGHVLVRDGNCSCERAGCRRRGGSPHARRRLIVRGGDLSEKPLPSWRLVGEASY
jgi:hypothetical protein